MKLDTIDIDATIADAKAMLAIQEQLTPEFRTLFSLVLTLLNLLAPRLKKKNSKNSSIPPSQDPYRTKQSKEGTGRKPGGQQGRVGQKLEPFDTVDEVITVKLDRDTLPARHTYRFSHVIKRQVVDVMITPHVTEYQLEVWVNEHGKEYIAPSPKGATQPIQYGDSVKNLSVYMSQYQLLPYARVEELFRDQLGIPISQGSIFNFNKEMYHQLASFEKEARHALQTSRLVYVDETSVNINGTLNWLHGAANDLWTLLAPHERRGKEGIDALGVLPEFNGVAVHDHWKSYYSYPCEHAPCHAHHLRELQAVIEKQPKHTWAKKMKAFLLDLNSKVDEAGGVLAKTEKQYQKYQQKYRAIIKQGEKEVPPPIKEETDKKKRGPQKKSKERNLLERFIHFEKDMLRFIEIDYVPFTNNQGERELRMAKVQQKISGCFKNMENAKSHARIRSYILSMKKQGINAKDALERARKLELEK